MARTTRPHRTVAFPFRASRTRFCDLSPVEIRDGGLDTPRTRCTISMSRVGSPRDFVARRPPVVRPDLKACGAARGPDLLGSIEHAQLPAVRLGVHRCRLLHGGPGGVLESRHSRSIAGRQQLSGLVRLHGRTPRSPDRKHLAVPARCSLPQIDPAAWWQFRTVLRSNCQMLWMTSVRTVRRRPSRSLPRCSLSPP